MEFYLGKKQHGRRKTAHIIFHLCDNSSCMKDFTRLTNKNNTTAMYIGFLNAIATEQNRTKNYTNFE